MKFKKILLVLLLMLCASGAYAQNKKFKCVLVKDANGNVHLVLGNTINGASQIVDKFFKQGDAVSLWKGYGEMKGGKILWVKELPPVFFRRTHDNPRGRFVVEPGEGIKELKSFLESNEGLAIKDKYFTSSTEYIASNEVNPHMTEDLTTLVDLFNGGLVERLGFLYEYIRNTNNWSKSDTDRANELKLIQKTAEDIIRIYESAIAIDPSLETTTYKEIRPYLDKIVDKSFSLNDFINNYEGYIKLLTNDLRKTFEKALNEASIVDGFNKDAIIREAKIILDADNIQGKYEAIKALTSLLKVQKITNTTFNIAELLVLRLTIKECKNIVDTATLIEFDPNYVKYNATAENNILNETQTDLKNILEDIIKAQENQYAENVVRKKGDLENTSTVEGMLEYSKKVFLEAGFNNSLDLFCLVFGNLKKLEEVVRRIERIK